MFETKSERAEIYRWMFLAIRLNGAIDSGTYTDIDVAVVREHIEQGDVFDFLRQRLGADLDYALDKLTDTDRHTLLKHWRMFARAYDPQQMLVNTNGLGLLLAYLLHTVQTRHAALPT